MTTKTILIALLLCICYIGHAHVEQTAKQMAESEHQRFANELPSALAKGQIGIFGAARERKQFFLEDDVNTFTEFLGWDKKKYNQSTLVNVFHALSEKMKSGKKNPNPVSVVIDFPAVPAETNVTVKTDPRGSSASYAVTTTVRVTVEAGKQGIQPSIAKNTVALRWEGIIPLANGEVNNRKKMTPPVLRSVKITPATDFPATPATNLPVARAADLHEIKESQMQARAKELIEEYYACLQPPINRTAVLAPEIPNKAELEHWLRNFTKIETGTENISIPLPTEGQIVEVKDVPSVVIHVDPVPFMTEDPSRYAEKEAYHQLKLTFTVDLQAEKITKVVFNDNFVRPVLALQMVKNEVAVTDAKPISQPVETVSQPVKQPVSQPVAKTVQPSGIHYKVQILYHELHSYQPLAELPQRFRVENLTIERYPDGYRYVVPAGNSLQEALAVQRQLHARGLEETWLAVYENGVRVRPPAGKPEIVL